MEGFSPKVLIVEDDRLLSMVACRLVEKIGCQVAATVDNGRDALVEIEEKNPDVVLMDIRLKGELDGIDTVEIIKRNFSVPVIYLSGSSYTKSFERAEEIGYEGFLQKPLQVRELEKAFQKVFSKDEPASLRNNKTKVG